MDSLPANRQPREPLPDTQLARWRYRGFECDFRGDSVVSKLTWTAHGVNASVSQQHTQAVKPWVQSNPSARATRATKVHCAWGPRIPSRSPSDVTNETGRLPAVHCRAVADRDASGLSPWEINCRHFVAILGDKGCYVK